MGCSDNRSTHKHEGNKNIRLKRFYFSSMFPVYLYDFAIMPISLGTGLNLCEDKLPDKNARGQLRNVELAIVPQQKTQSNQVCYSDFTVSVFLKNSYSEIYWPLDCRTIENTSSHYKSDENRNYRIFLTCTNSSMSWYIVALTATSVHSISSLLIDKRTVDLWSCLMFLP